MTDLLNVVYSPTSASLSCAALSTLELPGRSLCSLRKVAQMKEISCVKWPVALEESTRPCPHTLQSPCKQTKDHVTFVSRDDIRWESRQSKYGNKPIVQEAFLRTELVNDFIRGNFSGCTNLFERSISEIELVNAGEAILYQTDYTTANQQKSRSSAADIGRVQSTSFLTKLDLQCCFGSYRSQKLADSHKKPEVLTQTERAPGRRMSKCAREDSCKLGCQYRISILQYALWPWATRIAIQSMDHTNADRQQVHGPNTGQQERDNHKQGATAATAVQAVSQEGGSHVPDHCCCACIFILTACPQSSSLRLY